MAAIEFISLLKLVHLGIVMAPRAAAGFRCPEQPVLPPFPCCFSLGCAIAVPGCLLDPSPACAPCSGLWGGASWQGHSLGCAHLWPLLTLLHGAASGAA